MHTIKRRWFERGEAETNERDAGRKHGHEDTSEIARRCVPMAAREVYEWADSVPQGHINSGTIYQVAPLLLEPQLTPLGETSLANVSQGDTWGYTEGDGGLARRTPRLDHSHTPPDDLFLHGILGSRCFTPSPRLPPSASRTTRDTVHVCARLLFLPYELYIYTIHPTKSSQKQQLTVSKSTTSLPVAS